MYRIALINLIILVAPIFVTINLPQGVLISIQWWVFLSSLFLAYEILNEYKTRSIFLFILAFLYNPIIPLSFTNPTSTYIVQGFSIILFISLYSELKEPTNENKKD